ncbi:30S ribosomal protein S9 [Candidatus Woesearchaeota archaeon]|nr:30S ribosomal protein S9 [Candidatus Woesearchaeota archaeon]
MKLIHMSGTRKTASARATLREGKGVVRVNSQHITSFSTPLARAKIMEPLLIAGDISNNLRVEIITNGGGTNAQAEAARVAVARAMVAYDKKLEKRFLEYDRQLLVPDVRHKETRKPNRHGKARAKVQKSYR